MSEGMTARARAADEHIAKTQRTDDWMRASAESFLAGWDAALAKASEIANRANAPRVTAGWNDACAQIADAIAALRKGGA